jgi:hypothetical protein
MQVTLVDDLEHEFGGIPAHGEIADFIDHVDDHEKARNSRPADSDSPDRLQEQVKLR